MQYANIPSKPEAPITYDLTLSNHTDAPFIVFINGLGLPAASWSETINKLRSDAHTLTYDRYGQGATTARDPLDTQPGKQPGYGHDINDSVQDLHELLGIVRCGFGPLVFVAASIGVHIARLYASKYSQSVSALLFLDSNIGNVEFTNLWPDPYAEDFQLDTVLSEDCTLDQYTKAYDTLARTFNTDVKNPEGLDRRNIKLLLPHPSSPALKGPGNTAPWLTVVGHDPEMFSRSNLEKLGIPKSITAKFTQP